MKQFLIFILLSPLFCLSQNESLQKQRAVYLEIAGSGGLGSLNYEQSFFSLENLQLNWRAGFSLAPIDKNNGVGLVFPLMIHANIGRTQHKLDIGLGQGLTISTKGHFFTLTTASVGYKLQPENKKIFFRLSYTPLISYLVDFQVQHWGGLSFGYSFTNSN